MKEYVHVVCHDAIGCEITFNDVTGGDSTVLISWRPFHLIYKISWTLIITMTCAKTAYHSGAPEFIPDFS